jgi:UDP-N-acetylmuramoyl-tripeptide--D-alanyl-D-alanine ligase
MTLMLYDDSYNANPASIGAALDVLAAAEVTHDIGRVSKGRRIAYLGDMKELGPTGPEMHRALAGHPAVAAVDQIHAIGPLMRELWQVLPEQKRGRWCETADEMADHVHDDLDAGDVVLAKGSLGMGLARVVSAIRAMDDETRGRKGRG